MTLADSIASLLLNSCQSQVDLYSTLVSGLKVNKSASEIIVALGGVPPVDPATYDRLISSAQAELSEAVAVKQSRGL